VDFEALRRGGILKQRQKGYFILRTRIPGGYLKADMLPRFMRIAKIYGRGYIHISTRQGIEIAWIRAGDIDKLLKELKKLGIEKGACGPRSRNIVACPGSSVCRFGFVDTEKLAAKLNKDFFGLDVPKKFKIALSGCMNSCSKPQENDIGFMAQGEPEIDLDKCIKCTLCAKVCKEVCSRGKRESAIIMDKDNRPVYRKEFCLFEGDCVRVCPSSAWKTKRTGYVVFLGGKVGRFPMFGYRAAEFVDEKDVPEIVRKTIAVYNEIGKIGERFGEAIERTGIEEVKKKIL